MVPSEALAVTDSAKRVPPAARAATEGDKQAFVRAHFGFVWRSLRRLGLAEPDAEDALQQVFVVATGKLEDIEPGRERAFLFSTAMRVASRARRTVGRRREVLHDAPPEQVDAAPPPDEALDRARARALLDGILDTMPMELRAVFVLFEIEQQTTNEIARALDLPTGTVASRLRRARECFREERRRLEARRAFRGGLR